jgi:hypothetical protein
MHTLEQELAEERKAALAEKIHKARTARRKARRRSKGAIYVGKPGKNAE